jgi:hypothetical protein
MGTENYLLGIRIAPAVLKAGEAQEEDPLHTIFSFIF